MTGGGANLAAEYAALRHGAAAHDLPRDVLSASGADAASYLQGQCSQDVASLGSGDTADALLLSPQGKVEAFVRVTRRSAEEYIIDTDQGFGAAVIARLERFKLRVQVAFELLDWVCVALRGPDADEVSFDGPALVLPVEWPGLSGIDLLGPIAGIGGSPQVGGNLWVGGKVLQCGDEAWEAARIEAGIPLNGREIVEGTIAAEVGLVERTVSFTKGCFTGQELVARLDARGSKVARSLCGLVFEGASREELPPIGATVRPADPADPADGGQDAGHVTSIAWSPGLDAAVGMATLHRRVLPPAGVTVRWDTDGTPRRAPAEARPFPLVG